MATKEYSSFAYDIVNESKSSDLIDDIEIKVVDSSNINFSKEREGNQIKYKLLIPEQIVAGLEDEEILLSINLLMSYAVLTCSERPKEDIEKDTVTGMPSYKVKLLASTPIQLTDNLQSFSWLVIYPSILYGRIKEQIYEKALLNMLADIKTLNINSQSYSNDEKLVNIKNSLLSYKGAMNSTEAQDRFKQLFNSLELALKYDGSDERGEKFDKEVSNISGINTEQIKTWRRFYNKLKHGAQNAEDVNLIAKGVSNFYKDLPFLRHTANVVIHKRMRELLHHE